MDPISQGVIGAVAAQSVTRKNRQLKLAAAMGWIAGMMPDLDVLIRSSTDPLLGLEYHRHFTHALSFIPIGGVTAGVLAWLLTRRRHSLPQLIFFSTVGFATHGLLDTFTSYGTQLLWPFSTARIAWDSIAIIDLFFTIPLLVGMFLSLHTQKALWARFGLGVSALWMTFGAYQHHTLQQVQQQLASSRGHTLAHARVMPMLAYLNPLFTWRSVYKTVDGMIYVDGLRYNFGKKADITTGGHIPYYNVHAMLATLPADSPLAKDLRRYDWFTDGFTATLPSDPNTIIDVRYSPNAASTKPLWGITMDPANPDKHITRARFSRTGDEAAATNK